ncbi:MAG: hypothetical protein IPL40_13945 [Proteobacteria bacterium]|nr:hypothetical protein [Pseudomonadota bacterium]
MNVASWSARTKGARPVARARVAAGPVSGWWLLLALCALTSGSCKRRGAVEGPAQRARVAQTAPPAELLAHGGLRAPGPLLDRILRLVAGDSPLALGRRPIVQLALGLTDLPAALADALELERPLHFAAFDARLGDRAVVVALPIRSARAFAEALRSTLEQRGREGELLLWWPKGPAGGAGPLRVWTNERVALIAGSRRAFERGRAFILGRLVTTPLADDLVLRLNVPADAKRALDGLVASELAGVDGPGAAGNPLLGAAVVAAARERANDFSKHLSGLLASTKSLELRADFDGATLRVGGRAEARRGGALARLIKGQRTAAPFGAGLVAPTTWLFASLSRRPEPPAPGRARSDLLAALFDGARQALPVAERAAFTQATERFRARMLGDAALGLTGPGDGGGLAVTLLARLDGSAGAAEDVALIAAALQRAAFGPASAAASTSAPNAGSRAATSEPLALAGVTGGILRQEPPLRRRARAGGIDRAPAEPLAALFGAAPAQVGWLVAGATVALVVAGDARQALAPIAAALRGGAAAAAPPSLAQRPAFQRAAARAPARAGLVYLATDALIETLRVLGLPGLPEGGATSGAADARAALTLDWGVDEARGSIDGAMQLPISRLLALKPLLSQLATTMAALRGTAPAPATP